MPLQRLGAPVPSTSSASCSGRCGASSGRLAALTAAPRRTVRARAANPPTPPSSPEGPSKPQAPQPQKADAPSASSSAPRPAPPTPDALNLAFESDAAKHSKVITESPVKTTGLHRAPLSGGVKTATSREPGLDTGEDLTKSGAPRVSRPSPGGLPRYELPTPPVAVRNLVEHARFGHLCTMMSGMHHRRAGYPFGTLVDFASDGAGYPVFCLSPLAIHSRNLIEEPRCSLVVQMPGWTGLANARVTIFGDVYQLPPDLQDSAREIFIAKHSNERKERWVSGNFVYFRMNRIVDIYFVGGFGTVQWISPEEYLGSSPDEIVLNNPNAVLQVLNEQFAPVLRAKLGSGGRPLDELVFISIDASGVDMRVRCGHEFSVERIGFADRVANVTQVMAAMRQVVTDVSRSNASSAASSVE
ncbi:hypothetical protein HYH03_003205 [Edaphochlamys debaryana]|uniref:CREG-like beta-barrel domain-containing protein n=1 Tax=Edaphochlamys debaryana TaxID=47281 RepID=A0A835Y9V7_9CHLO|nr:hypothetical protein HYH03_003205 [Edaphochlamys debaryana]|eukprot:KAG2499020.1 hypothetical protein HYH03_003205 [Edaphochlamys debaryana]